MQRFVPSGKGNSLRISLPRKDFENPSSHKGFVDPFREGGFLWNRLQSCQAILIFEFPLVCKVKAETYQILTFLSSRIVLPNPMSPTLFPFHILLGSRFLFWIIENDVRCIHAKISWHTSEPRICLEWRDTSPKSRTSTSLPLYRSSNCNFINNNIKMSKEVETSYFFPFA